MIIDNNIALGLLSFKSNFISTVLFVSINSLMRLEEQIYCPYFPNEEMGSWGADSVTHLDNDRARCLLVPLRFLSTRSAATRTEAIFSFPSWEELDPIKHSTLLHCLRYFVSKIKININLYTHIDLIF